MPDCCMNGCKIIKYGGCVRTLRGVMEEGRENQLESEELSFWTPNWQVQAGDSHGSKKVIS